MPAKEKVIVENVNVRGYSSRVDAKKYEAMRKVLLKVVPKSPQGITQKELFKAILPHLPTELWPGGEKSGWWAKTVQLDLEAKGVIQRDSSAKPLRWHLA